MSQAAVIATGAEVCLDGMGANEIAKNRSRSPLRCRSCLPRLYDVYGLR
jgi:hypothetical protein